jgi:hypothetical protein
LKCGRKALRLAPGFCLAGLRPPSPQSQGLQNCQLDEEKEPRAQATENLWDMSNHDLPAMKEWVFSLSIAFS